MRILQFIYELAPGGAERFVVDLCNSHANLGHEVILCVLRDDSIGNNGFYKKEISKSVQYMNLKIPEGLRFSNIHILYKVIKQIKPDVVHCHLNLINYIFPLTFLFSKTKFFHTIHNDAPKEISNKAEYFIRRFFYSKSIVNAITISKDTSTSFSEFYKTDRYEEIFNGRSIPQPTKELKTVKKEIQRPNRTAFIHVGRFNKQKNQYLLISVFNKLTQNGYPVDLYIIGPGFDSPKAQKLKDTAGSNIYFLGPKHNIADYYYAADAFCLSSIHEGMPITLIEAFACGCPAVCTPAGGIKEMIITGVNGYVSDTISEEAYYESLSRFLESKNKIDRQALINLFSSNYHINVCAKNYLNAYKKNGKTGYNPHKNSSAGINYRATV
ncbi:glycosyltransferase [uncultured Draconibacterium sp.]|uniref:glycosyltransferase n=1 Tax=uncultured Draconibacterium sp. TaxID=1573823 RepID=UPI0029C6F742|nr:glycosyltransferase [uncultured Draconibacterium sp.]